MKKSSNIIIKSILLAIVGAIILGYSVLSVHNNLVCNNQIKNNHEKLDLISEKIEQSKQDEEDIRAVYDEMYQSKADSLAFQLRYITDINLNDTYAKEMADVYDINYLSVIENGSTKVEAGSKLSDNYHEYYGTINDNSQIYIQVDDEELNNDLEKNASLSAVLDNVSVGQSGFVLAFHTEKGTVIFSPNSDEIGMDANKLGVDISSISDNADFKLTYNGTLYFASSRQIDKGMIVTVVPYSEITANDLYTVVISETVYWIFMSIVILYFSFLRKEVKDEEDAKRTLNKKLGAVVLVGTLLSFTVCFYMNTLFTLSEQSVTNNKRSQELLVALKNNDDTLSLQKEQYNEQCSQKLDEAAYILKNVDASYLDKEFMTDLKDVLKVNSVMYFDLDGNVIAANTDNWSYSISKDPSEQSYEYWDILNGSRTKIIQDVQTNVNGNLRQYMANSVQDDSYHTIGMVTLSATVEQIEKSTINTDVASVLSGISTGNKGFAFGVNKTDEDTYTFAYFPNESLIGKNVLNYGMNEDELVSDYNDFIEIDGTTYYCASSSYNDLLTYIAVPFSALNITAFPISLTTSFIMVIFMGTLWLLYANEKVEVVEEKEEDQEQVDVEVANGRTAKARSVLFRWSHNGIKWEAMSAGQKTSYILHIILTILAFIVMTLVLFKNKFFTSNSLFLFVLSCKWQKGINIFSITYCLLILICVIEISLIVRKIIMWVAHSLNAKGETICRLIDNFIKFATVLCLFYFCLATLGVDTSTLVTSAGILTLIVGLGAQSLVSDILAGLFIVFEGEFQVGDIVTIDGFIGRVVEIGVRTTKVKEGSGNVKIFSNSSVKNILNMTKDYSVVSCDLIIKNDEDLRYVEKVLKEEFPAIKAKLPAIVDGPFYRGVSEFGDSTITIKVIAKCLEGDRVQLDRDLRRQLKLVFDKHEINNQRPDSQDDYHETTAKEDKQVEIFVKKQNEEFKDTGIKEE